MRGRTLPLHEHGEWRRRGSCGILRINYRLRSIELKQLKTRGISTGIGKSVFEHCGKIFYDSLVDCREGIERFLTVREVLVYTFEVFNKFEMFNLCISSFNESDLSSHSKKVGKFALKRGF